jgi:hypothetical protein
MMIGRLMMVAALSAALGPAMLFAEQEKELKKPQAANDRDKQVADAQLKQYLQLLQPAMWRELEFVRLTCKLTPEQRPKIKAAAEEAVMDAARLFLRQPNQPIVQQPNPTVAGQKVRQKIHAALEEHTSREQFAAFRLEAEKRRQAIEEVTILNTVAHLDGALFLSKEQREAIAAALKNGWKEEWEHWLAMRRYGDQYFPQVPDSCVVPHLSADQRAVWVTLQKTTIYGWMNENVPHDEVWWSGREKDAADACAAFADDEIVRGPPSATPENHVELRNLMMNFDNWVFGVGDAKAGRERLESQIKLQISEASRICQLADEQRAKLELAARGDLQRFVDDVEQARRKALADKPVQEALNNLHQLAQPLQLRQTRGISGPDSLFARSLASTLTAGQVAAYEALVAERRRYRYEAAIGLALYNLEPTVAMNQAQREALVKVLLELPPPRVSSSSDYIFVWYRFATARKDTVKPLFSDRQWQALQQCTDRYRGMREHFVQLGYLDRDEDASVKPAKDQP